MGHRNPDEALITRVLQRYFPGWDPVPDRKEWNQCLCPAHDESRPSASVSYENDAVKCQACGFKGDAIAIIKREEGIAYGAAVKRAEELSGGSYQPISRKPQRKPGRRVFGDARADGPERGKGGRQVPPWLRG